MRACMFCGRTLPWGQGLRPGETGVPARWHKKCLKQATAAAQKKEAQP